MTDYARLLQTLHNAKVEFIVIGGVAAIGHGSPRFTQDVDVVYRRTPENIDRLTAALAPLQPYFRGAPPGLPFRFDSRTVRHGLNFTLSTEAGALDLLGEMAGGGTYEQLIDGAEHLPLFGTECACLNLRQLIEAKRAAGRPKDFEALAELEILLEEMDE